MGWVSGDAIGVIIGTLIGSIIASLPPYFIEKRRERREKHKDIYSPLYDEISETLLSVSGYVIPKTTPVWSKLKRKHLVSFITPSELNHKLRSLYDFELNNFQLSLNSLQLSLIERIISELKITVKGTSQLKYANNLALNAISSSAEHLYYLNVNFKNFKKRSKLRFENLTELNAYLFEEMKKISLVLNIRKEHRELMNTLNYAQNTLEKELGIKPYWSFKLARRRPIKEICIIILKNIFRFLGLTRLKRKT